MKIIPKDQKFYIRSMGKLLLVTGIFTSDDECNAWLKNHRDHGVVAVIDESGNPTFGDGLVITANLYDKGIKAA